MKEKNPVLKFIIVPGYDASGTHFLVSMCRLSSKSKISQQHVFINSAGSDVFCLWLEDKGLKKVENDTKKKE